MQNPFTIGIARNEDFCNRQEELVDLINYAKNGQNVVLYSPRRYGKSSLVNQVLRELEKERILTVYVDLFPVSSEHDFVSMLATGVLKGIGRGTDPRTFGDKVRNLFSRLVPVFEVTPEGMGIFVKFDRSAKLELLLDDLMEGMYNYVKKKKLRACIALDEFQEVTELTEAKKIEGILRSHIQSQKEIAYFYIGSRRRTLKDIFTDKGRPLYKSAFLYTLREIPKEDFIQHIRRKFEESRKKCPPDVAGKIYDMVRGYPYYVQKLALLTWDITDKSCNVDLVATAYKLLIKMETPDFEGIWSGLTLIQKAVLKAIAREPTTSPFAKEYLERFGLTIGGAQKAIQALLEKDLIEKDAENRYRLTDPIMGAWLRE